MYCFFLSPRHLVNCSGWLKTKTKKNRKKVRKSKRKKLRMSCFLLSICMGLDCWQSPNLAGQANVRSGNKKKKREKNNKTK